MKKRFMGIAACLFTFLFLPNLFAQGTFEGKVIFQVMDESMTQNISYFVKDDKFRIEPEESKGQGVMIYDSESKTMIVVMPEQKMYMEMPMQMDSENMETDENGLEYFKNTGETKEINGYTCERFIFKDEEGEGEAWMTKGLGGFLFFTDFGGGQPKEEEWQKAMMDEGYFPMEVSMVDESGNSKQVFRVIELTPMDLDDALFAPPAGFQKLDMKGMMSK